MAVFCILGAVGLFIFFLLYVIEIGDFYKEPIKSWATVILTLFLMIVLIVIPLVKNNIPTSTTHHVYHTDYWVEKDIRFDKVVSIEYDTQTFNWWTFSRFNQGDKINIVISQGK